MKPTMQISDDHGAFRGWVGVEASFYPSSARENDRPAVFRAGDFR